MRILSTIDLGVCGLTLGPDGITFSSQQGGKFFPDTEAYELGELLVRTYGTTRPMNPSLLEKERLQHDIPVPDTQEKSRALPDKDTLASRSAGGPEAASKLKVGDAFKAPGDYAEGKKSIYGVSTVDLGQLAQSASVVEKFTR